MLFVALCKYKMDTNVMSFSSWHMIFILSEGGRPQVLTTKMTCTQHRTIPKLLQVVDLPFNCVIF